MLVWSWSFHLLGDRIPAHLIHILLTSQLSLHLQSVVGNSADTYCFPLATELHQQELSGVLTLLWCLHRPVSLPCPCWHPCASHIVPWQPLRLLSAIRNSTSHHWYMSLQSLPHCCHRPTSTTFIILGILWLLMIYYYIVKYLYWVM